jgi:hypothetical protein
MIVFYLDSGSFFETHLPNTIPQVYFRGERPGFDVEELLMMVGA